MSSDQLKPLFSICLCSTLILSSLVGCQSVNKETLTDTLFPPLTGSKKEPDIEFGVPAKMAVIWRETAMSNPLGPGTRGFGGRVYFYDAQSDPVRVDGELIVYAFDDSTPASDMDSRVPDRKYVFRRSELQKHYSETDIGHSYSVWVPWDKVGGFRKTIALLPMFKPAKGSIVKSDQSIVLLPGKVPEDVNAQKAESPAAKYANSIRQVSGTDDDQYPPNTVSVNKQFVAPGEAQRYRRKTTTIKLPRSLSRQMSQLNQLENIHAQSAALKKLEENKKHHLMHGNEAWSNTFQQGYWPPQMSGQMPMQYAGTPTTNPAKPEKPAKRPVFGQPGAYR